MRAWFVSIGNPTAVTNTATSALSPTSSAEELRLLLKRCSPSTYAAAFEFRRTRDPAHLPAIIYGIIERYVERPLRPHLQAPAEDVRLVADLGLDSLTLTELVVLAEEVLQVPLSPEEPPPLRTLADLQHYLSLKLN